jgi:Na+/proline symporter
MSTATTFQWADWIVLVGYFVGITVFGIWIARRLRSSKGYFLGDRKLPWWVMIGQSFGTGTNAENPVAQTGASYHLGFATIWYQWKNMLITPFYWLIAPWYRRSGCTTIGEIVEQRYGRTMAAVYAVFGIAFLVFNQGAMLLGAAKIISVATGGMISPEGVVAGMTAAFILYSLVGGLTAAAYTDFVQGFLIIVLSFMLIPTGLATVGGIRGLHQSLPSSFFDLYSAVSGLDGFTILMLTLNGLIGITAMPHMLTMCATGATERGGRIGITYGSIVKRFCTIGWAFTGLIVAAMLVRSGDTLADPEHAFGYACLRLLGPGWVGLMVACVLAANMSTCSNFMVNTGALFTQDVYKRYMKPDATDGQLLWMGRLSGLGLTLLGVIFALTVRQVLQAFLFTETIAALMGIMFAGGFFWKRANRYGAMAATLASFTTYYTMNWLATGEVKLVYKWTPAPFAWALLAGCVGLILVSLLTCPEDEKRVAAFFDRMKPQPGEEGREMLLLDLPGWFSPHRWAGFWRRYREDVTGFVWGALSVAALIAVAWVVLNIGR